MTAKFPDQGALPHRTIAPRPGELEKQHLPAQPQPLLTPLMYVDAKTYMREWQVTVCPTCVSSYMHLIHVGIVRRDRYEPVEQFTVTEWRGGHIDWDRVPLLDGTKGDSVVLEFLCEEGHTSIVELGNHKGLLPTRVTRLGKIGDARM